MNNTIPRRRPPGSWPADFGQGRFVDTIPTQPGHLDGAHACSEVGQDDEPALGEGAGVLLVPLITLAAVAAWALYAMLTAPL
jgi:hypothetical protein